MERSIEEVIKHRRRQMLVHSYIYYTLGDSIVSDDAWQRWANELVVLQKEHGNTFDFYDEAFVDWTGATGMHLPATDYVVRKAIQLLRYENE